MTILRLISTALVKYGSYVLRVDLRLMTATRCDDVKQMRYLYWICGGGAISAVTRWNAGSPTVARIMEYRWQMIKDNHVKGPWSPEEDALLKVLVEEYGSKKW